MEITTYYSKSSESKLFQLQAKVSFLDPANTYSVSAFQTACGGDVMQGYKSLKPEDVENIYRMCL